MSTILVKFIDVGRGKKTWEERVLDDGNDILNSIRKNTKIVNRSLSIQWESSGMSGVIIAGGHRPIGKVRIVDE